MALIAVVTEPSGATRMFFDLRATRLAQEDERRIAATIAQAQKSEAEHLHRAA